MATFTNQTKSVITTGAGTMIGFLSGMTYSGSVSPVAWTNATRNSATFTNLTKS